MLVFWKERLAFLAVPKTGTTAIENALSGRASVVVRDPPELKHTPAYRFERFVLPYFQTIDQEPFETMAVIRHPVDWLGSWYRYRSRPALSGMANSTEAVSFDDFVLEYCRGKPKPFANVGSQARFVQDKTGECGITHLFRYEDQAGVVAFLEDRLQVRLDLQRVNVSPIRPMSLSPEVLAHLQAKRPEEFAIWDKAGRPAP